MAQASKKSKKKRNDDKVSGTHRLLYEVTCVLTRERERDEETGN